jgi:DNA-binding NarL/FixJ family response regulator
LSLAPGRGLLPLSQETVFSIPPAEENSWLSYASTIVLLLRRWIVPKIRVLLADDHQAMLTRVRRELSEEFEIVAMVGDGQAAVDAVMLHDPDVLVTDISMPVMDGLQVVSLLKGSHCRVRVVFLTIHEDADFFDAAFSAGASAYVTKARLSTDLILAIREVLKGHTFASPVESER